MTVAIVDTGIDPSHEDLAANVVGGYATDEAACGGSCEEPWTDDQGHGTHVAGTVGAVDNGTGVIGVAPGVDLLGVGVLGGDGSGSFSGVAEGIEWAVENGADVLNMSLGGDSQTDVVKDALQYAQQNGVVPVAAGNSGPCSDCVGYPGAEPESIAVSSTDQNDNLSFFSSTGPEVDIAAPGSGVNSTTPDDSYGQKSGTSMTSPHVAGAAASVLSAGIGPKYVRLAPKTAAADIGLSGNEQGSGRIDVAETADGPYEPSPVEVSTGTATGVDETSATLGGSLVNLDGASSADVVFEYGPAGSGLPSMVDAGTASGGEEFSASISGLEWGTAYEFTAVASAGGESDEGSVASFETDDEFSFCFITTATAGETETLGSLRRFRDDSMRATPVGRGLVELYYRISPPIARTLDRHPDSPEAGLTPRVVETGASLSDRQAETDSIVGSAPLGVALTMLYLIGLAVGVAGHASLRTREALGR